MNAMQRFVAAKPRTASLAIIAIAIGLLGVNYLAAIHFRVVSRGVLGGSLGLFFVGLWVLVTGRADPTGKSAPLWWNIGVVTLFILGVGLGMYIIASLK